MCGALTLYISTHDQVCRTQIKIINCNSHQQRLQMLWLLDGLGLGRIFGIYRGFCDGSSLGKDQLGIGLGPRCN